MSIKARCCRYWALRKVASGDPRQAELSGGIPGVLLTPHAAGNSTTRERPIEVDVFALRDGRCIVCECKAAGSELRPLDIERITQAGRRLECSRVVLATATDFSTVPELVQGAREAGKPSSLEIFEFGDLFDHGREPDDYLAHLGHMISEERVFGTAPSQ